MMILPCSVPSGETGPVAEDVGAELMVGAEAVEGEGAGEQLHRRRGLEWRAGVAGEERIPARDRRDHHPPLAAPNARQEQRQIIRERLGAARRREVR